MIKFFRKIRQQLLTENKFSKYLVYALGEIILVVIGILIALQINIANESRKTNHIQHDYYRQIIADLDKETQNINERITSLDSCIYSADAYWKYVETPNLKPSQILDELFKVETSFRYLTFNTNTIQTLESTGDIKLMSEEIRNNLIELKRTQDHLSRVAKGNYGVYLDSHEEILQLGFVRLKNKTPVVQELGIENNIPLLIVSFEGGMALKNFTDKLIRDSLLEMLSDIKKTKDLILTAFQED